MIRNKPKRKGQALLEYVFLIAGIAFICLLAVAVFGHKLADQYAIAAGMLPGAHEEDNLPVTSVKWVGYTENADGDAIVGTGAASWLDIVGSDQATTGGGLVNNVMNLSDATMSAQGTTVDGEVFVAD